MDDIAPLVHSIGKPGMSRRRFIAGMATAASALAGASALALSEGTARAAGNRLPVPELLVPTQQGGVTVFALRAARATWQLLPGVTSGSAGFNGPYLGPTLRVRNGQRVRFEVTNGLDEDLAVHWHGAHVPPQDDGGVHAAFGPGQVWKPEFTVKQQAATLWYHPHTMGITARQLSMGLAGVLIVEDDSAASKALPSTYGTDDIPVILQSVAVGPDGGIRYASHSFSEPGMAFPLVVNGVAVDGEPLTFTASTGRVRLRLLNASLSETLTVRRIDGTKLTQVATESAFLNRATQVSEVRMPAGARAEVVVDVSRETVLETMVETGVGRSRNGRGPFLTLLPGSGGGKRTALPARLNTIHRYDVSHLRPRVIALTENGGMLGINGVSGTTMKAMDAHEIVVREGDLELWEVVNRSPRNHSFHVHDVPFQVISVNGRPPTGVDLGWRDTIAVHRGARVRIAMRFTDYASDKYTYMLHCHMAEHEDLGMMTSLKVRPR